MMAACGGDLEKINAKIVIDAAKAGDATAKAAFDQYVYGLAVGIINIINMIDPEVIVLGGGVSHEGDGLFLPLSALLEKIALLAIPDAKVPETVSELDERLLQTPQVALERCRERCLGCRTHFAERHTHQIGADAHHAQCRFDRDRVRL